MHSKDAPTQAKRNLSRNLVDNIPEISSEIKGNKIEQLYINDYKSGDVEGMYSPVSKDRKTCIKVKTTIPLLI